MSNVAFVGAKQITLRVILQVIHTFEGMAGIKSLAVRGIRSFGPDENDEQRVSFEKPLTLILGQNGCGKTTIIESIRYAITGQMPPGSRNECFVHDTKVNRTTEVLGQVKLKVRLA